MSSVKSSGSNDEVGQVRNDYKTREAESYKKHKKEVTDLSKQYTEKLDNIREEYDKQMQELRMKNRELLSSRDMQHHEDIQEVRNLYAEQLRRKSIDAEERKKTNEQTFTKTITKEREIAQQQKDVLRNDFSNTLQDRERNFNDYAERSRDTMKKTLEDQNKKLSDKHNEERSILVADRDREVGTANRNLAENKSEYENRLKTQDRQHSRTMDKNNDNWFRNYRKQEEQNDTLLQGRNEVFQDARADMQDKYREKLDKEIKGNEVIMEDLRNKVEERQDGQFQSLKTKLTDQQSQQTNAQFTMNRQKGMEKKHLVEQYEKRLAQLGSQRDQIKDLANEEARRRIEDINHKNGSINQEASRKVTLDKNLQNSRHKEDRAQIEVAHENETQYLKDRTDERVKKIVKVTNDSQRIQQRGYEQNLTEIKGVYANNLAEQRDAQLEGLKNIQLRMQKRLNETENKNQKKVDMIVENYEVKIDKMSEEQKQKLQDVEATAERRIKTVEKVHDLEQATQNQKFEMKMTALEEAHAKELDRLEKRHQEQMASLSQRVSYYKKKS